MPTLIDEQGNFTPEFTTELPNMLGDDFYNDPDTKQQPTKMFENIIPDPVGIDRIAFENSLNDAYPNPFNPTTTIKYTIKERAHVSLKVYNVAGQLVRTLVDDMQAPTEAGFAKEWNGMNDQGAPVSSGVYFYKLVTNNFSQTKKMVLLK